MKIKTFSGGYTFKNFGNQPADTAVTVGIPPKVVISLLQGFGVPLQSLVNVGDRVLAGQILARNDDSVSSPVHSSVAGTVTGIETINYFNRQVSAVVIEPDQSGDCETLEGFCAEWENLPNSEIERLLYVSGVTGLGTSGIPTRFKTSVIEPENVEHLIIHGAESEPFNLSLSALLITDEAMSRFIAGALILKKIMPNAQVHIALNKNQTTIVKSIEDAFDRYDGFSVYGVEPKYPQDYVEVLIPTLLKTKFPYGFSSANMGIVALEVQDVIRVHEAVVEGKPLIETTLALSGPGFKKNLHAKVRIGTPIEFILKNRLIEKPNRIVVNNLLAGERIDDLSLPVDKTFSQIIALPENTDREFMAFVRPGAKKDSFSRSFLSSWLGSTKTLDTNMHGEKRPCIQCGYCISVCPVKIYPATLYRYDQANISEALLRYEIFNCIDCGLCSYVCPSKIPLASALKKAKAKLGEIGCDHWRCILPKFDLRGLEEYKGVKSTR